MSFNVYLLFPEPFSYNFPWGGAPQLNNANCLAVTITKCSPSFVGFGPSQAGVFSRGNAAGASNSAPVNTGSNYHGLSNANGNVGFQRRASYLAGNTGQQNEPVLHRDMPNMRLRPTGPTAGSGLTAWGIITIIVCVIVLGFCGYYGIICYPLFFHHGNRYNTMMDGNSTNTTTSSSTGSPDLRKINYGEEDDYGRYPKLDEKAQWAAAH